MLWFLLVFWWSHSVPHCLLCSSRISVVLAFDICIISCLLCSNYPTILLFLFLSTPFSFSLYTALEPRVFQKQLFYLHEVVVRSAYPYTTQTQLVGFHGYVVGTLVELLPQKLVTFCNSLKMEGSHLGFLEELCIWKSE